MKVAVLENQVAVLWLEIEEIRKINQEKLEYERQINSDQFLKLSNIIADIEVRLSNKEKNQTDNTEMVTNVKDSPNKGKIHGMKHNVDKKKANISTENNKEVTSTSTSIYKEGFKCDQCDFESSKEITLLKHKNTKHEDKVTEKEIEIKVSNSKCLLCEDRFESDSELKKHVEEHIKEIESLDITSITNGHECNLCSFESGYGDSIREYMIDHVKPTRENNPADKSKEIAEPTISLLDEYDDDGNYTGDNPKYMDSDNKDSSAYEEEESDE